MRNAPRRRCARPGTRSTCAALLRIELVADAELGPGPWSALVLTSANALRALEHASAPRRAARASGVRGRPPHRRRGRARPAFATVTAAGGNVQELVQHLRATAAGPCTRCSISPGEDRSGDLAADLAADGRIVSHRGGLPRRQAGQISARAGGCARGRRDRRRAALLAPQRAGLSRLRPRRRDARSGPGAITHFCVSRQVAEPLLAAGAKRVRIAARPEEAALIELIEAES